MCDSTPDIPLKQCSCMSECQHPEAVNGWLPATSDYFMPTKSTQSGLWQKCHTCRKNAKRRQYWKNHEKSKASNKANYTKFQDKRIAYAREYRAQHPNQIRDSLQQYASAHKQQLQQYQKTYRRNNKEKRRVYEYRRIARQRMLPSNLTESDWQRCLDYFNGCCAACERQLNNLLGTHRAAMDHWIALSDPRHDNPGTVPTNIIPLCHGEGGCNNSKADSDPAEWLERKFGKRKAKQILERIQAYFDSLK